MSTDNGHGPLAGWAIVQAMVQIAPAGTRRLRAARGETARNGDETKREA